MVFQLIHFISLVRSCVQTQGNQSCKLAVCQRTGTIVCGKDQFLKLYKFDECVNENTHFKYIDFMEVPFEVELEFVPTHLSINEHIVACANAEFMCVFKLSEQSYFNTANSITSSSDLSIIVPIPMCPVQDNPDQVFDYQNASKRFLSSITSNISSTFDYQMETNSDRMKFGRDRSIEMRPSFIDNALPLCNLRHFPANNDDVGLNSGWPTVIMTWMCT